MRKRLVIAAGLFIVIGCIYGCSDKGGQTSQPQTDIPALLTPSGIPSVAAPSVLYKDPVVDAANVAANAAINVVFDKTMDPATINSTTFTVSPAVSDSSIAYNNNVVTFAHTSAFANDTTYTVTLGTDIKDASAVALASAVTWNFRTVAAAAATPVPPSPPTDFMATIPASHGMKLALSWSACSDCTSYTVARIPSVGGQVSVCTKTEAPFSCDDTGLIKGTLYTYLLEACGTPATNCARTYVPAPQPIPVRGDVNGDGIADFIVGAPFAGGDAGAAPGKAYLYIGRSDGNSDRLVTITGDTSSWFSTGRTVAFVGDLNDDGYEDFAVGAKHAERESRYKIGIFFGGPSLNSTMLMSNTNIKIMSDAESFVSFASALDVDGDNIEDVIIGAGTGGTVFGNLAYVIPGRKIWSTDYTLDTDTGKISYIDRTFTGPTAVSVSSAGSDFNGDNRAEVIVGIPSKDKVKILTMDPAELRDGFRLIPMPGGEFTGESRSNFGQTIVGYGWIAGAGAARVRTIFVGAPLAPLVTAGIIFTNAGKVYSCSFDATLVCSPVSGSGASGLGEGAEEKWGTTLCGGVNGGGFAYGSPYNSSSKGLIMTKSSSYRGEVAGDLFGNSCAVSKPFVAEEGVYTMHIISASGFDHGRGAVYLLKDNYNPAHPGAAPMSTFRIDGDAVGDNFGYSVGAKYYSE